MAVSASVQFSHLSQVLNLRFVSAAPQTNLATELFTAIECHLQYTPALFTEVLECALHKHHCFITLYHIDGLNWSCF